MGHLLVITLLFVLQHLFDFSFIDHSCLLEDTSVLLPPPPHSSVLVVLMWESPGGATNQGSIFVVVHALTQFVWLLPLPFIYTRPCSWKQNIAIPFSLHATLSKNLAGFFDGLNGHNTCQNDSLLRHGLS